MRPRQRHVRRPPDLTSLFDVLFIVVFAALIRAAAVEQAAAAKSAPPPEPAAPRAAVTPPPIAALRQRALDELSKALADRSPLVVRITRDGTVEAIEADGVRRTVTVPLLEHSGDRDVELTYLGDRAPDLRVCRIAAHSLGTADLSRYLVIMAPAAARDDLTETLRRGLQRDVGRCLEQRGIATLIDAAAPAAPTPTSPGATR
jgi:hypothetical protein